MLPLTHSPLSSSPPLLEEPCALVLASIEMAKWRGGIVVVEIGTTNRAGDMGRKQGVDAERVEDMVT